MNRIGGSTASDFEGVEVLMDSCDFVGEATERITDTGYCHGFGQQELLARSASRVAVLQTLADQGVAYISAKNRNRLPELAEEVRNLS